MKTILALILAASLTGCYQVTSIVDITAAQQTCEEHKGIYSIEKYVDAVEVAICMDGYTKTLNQK